MKKKFTILCGILFAMTSFAQTIEINTELGSGWGGGVEVDINNNGHLDLIFGGLSSEPIFLEDPDGNEVESHKATKLLMFNTETNTFEEKTTNIINADRANFIAQDFNRDGIMDLLIAEHARDVFYAPGIYEGVGDGTFVKADMTFDDQEYEFRPVTVNAADFNNDGLMDIVAIGYENINDTIHNHSAVLINQGDYDFKVTNTELLHDYELALATVKVLDHNNDGYMDFFVSANCDNPASNSGARVLADIFENLGEDEPGTFYRLFLGDGTIFQKANGGLNIADFNQDGWLDFAIHGEGGEGTGEPTGGDVWACISHVYINQKNGTYADKTQPDFSADIRPLNSSGTSTGVTDWDGDGTPDVFIPGWNPAPETETQAGFYWLNDGSGAFSNKTRVPGASEIFMLFPDWDGDGVRDYFMAGQSWDSEYLAEEQKGRVAITLINERTTVNERPSAPSGLTATPKGNSITLSWDAGSDSETPATGLSYEYYIKKDNVFYTSCRSHVGGDLDGIRKVLDLGNAMQNKSITLNGLPDGAYEWGVQAIDASFDGSVFAGSQFTIGSSTVIDRMNDLDTKVNILVDKNTLNVTSELNANIEVYTLTGALIATQHEVSAYNITLNQGVYIVRLSIDNQVLTKKILIK